MTAAFHVSAALVWHLPRPVFILCPSNFLLQNLSKSLKKSPSTLEDLKFVLATIAEIRSKSLLMELRYRDVQERYRTMAAYNLHVSGRLLSPHFPAGLGRGGCLGVLLRPTATDLFETSSDEI